MRATAFLFLLGLTVVVTGCEKVEVLMDERRPDTPHEAYLQGLHDAGLATTALSQEWITEAAEAVRNPLPVELPFQEEGYISPEEPEAVGYRFSYKGRSLLITGDTVKLENIGIHIDGREVVVSRRMPGTPQTVGFVPLPNKFWETLSQ